MKSIKIAIISKSNRIRDFFRLEALNFGFSIDCFEKIEPSSDHSVYDLAIIDIDTVTQKPLNSAKKEIFISEGANKADYFYPLHLSVLQEIYRSLYKKDASASDVNENEDLKIVFYKDLPNVISLKSKKYLLSDTEYNLLKLLCQKYPSVVCREELLKIFPHTGSNIFDVYICKLRKKLEEPLKQRLIYTVRSKGYKTVVDSEWR